MRVPAQIIADPDAGEVLVVVPAADGRGEVVLLTLPIDALSLGEASLLPGTDDGGLL